MCEDDHCVESVATRGAQDRDLLLDGEGSALSGPDGWTWQWVVQEDGQTGILSDLLPEHPQISTGTGRHGGAGVARTLALSRATGDLVRVLDVDDQLTPGALARDIRAVTDHPDIGWTTSRVLDLLPDGSTVGFEHDPPAGTIAIGAVLEHWEAHDYRAQVHPATLCIRRGLLLALGGWMALPASEDTGLLLAANALTPGYFTPDIGLLYRKWPGQATAQPEHQDPTERNARMHLIAARARTLRSSVQLASRASH